MAGYRGSGPVGVQGENPSEIYSVFRHFRIKSSIMKTFFNRVLHIRKLVQIQACLSQHLTVYIVYGNCIRI